VGLLFFFHSSAPLSVVRRHTPILIHFDRKAVRYAIIIMIVASAAVAGPPHEKFVGDGKSIRELLQIEIAAPK
jgi:hypothetical protein